MAIKLEEDYGNGNGRRIREIDNFRQLSYIVRYLFSEYFRVKSTLESKRNVIVTFFHHASDTQIENVLFIEYTNR